MNIHIWFGDENECDETWQPGKTGVRMSAKQLPFDTMKIN